MVVRSLIAAALVVVSFATAASGRRCSSTSRASATRTLDLDRYIEQAPDTHKPEGDGHSRYGPDGIPMPREWRQILK